MLKRRLFVVIVATGAFAAVVVTGLPTSPSVVAATNVPVYSYAAKFVCQEALAPGTFAFGPTAPIVEQKTDVLVHNPHGFTVTVYKKAVEARLEYLATPAPGGKVAKSFGADKAFRIDCDDIARLLTNSSSLSVTFRGTYGTGVKKEGFVVIHSANPIDVTAQYVRGSEVLKKDITYQPWWSYWASPLPWALGRVQQRVLPKGGERECRTLLRVALKDEVDREGTDAGMTAQQITDAKNALDNGSNWDSRQLPPRENVAKGIVPVGLRCDMTVDAGTASDLVQFVLVSNTGPNTTYPWTAGRWHDLTMVIPQNLSIDLDQYLRDKLATDWDTATALNRTQVDTHMLKFVPFWCGYGYFYDIWRGGDCIDIGVGEGESLDVEQVTSIKITCRTYPPVDQDGDNIYDEGGTDTQEC